MENPQNAVVIKVERNQPWILRNWKLDELWKMKMFHLAFLNKERKETKSRVKENNISKKSLIVK